MDFELQVEPRSTVRRGVGKLRREGLVPGIIYGHKVSPLLVEMPAKEFSRLFQRAGHSHLLQLNVKGERTRRPVLIRELQLNPRNSSAVHVDFFQVNLTEKLNVQVPVVLTGESPTVKLGVGEMLHLIHSIDLNCLPNAIPGEIDLDISHLVEMDDSIRLSEIELPEGVELSNALDPDEIVVKLAPPRVMAEEPVAEEAAAEEGAAAEGSGDDSEES